MALGEQFTDVLNAARAGAPWALETLYREFHPAVLAFLRGRAPAEAEDLASDVFIAVAEGLVRFEGDEEGFRSWLFTITYRQVGQLRRRMGRRRTDPFPIDEVGERVPPGDAESDAMAAISTQQALDLMTDDTYQEIEEARAKLQRAQLSSCQLPTYYAGWKGWLQVRERYQQKQGGSFSLKEFHERALKESAVPLPTLERLLL